MFTVRPQLGGVTRLLSAPTNRTRVRIMFPVAEYSSRDIVFLEVMAGMVCFVVALEKGPAWRVPAMLLAELFLMIY